jgi:hypothetical protein
MNSITNALRRRRLRENAKWRREARAYAEQQVAAALEAQKRMLEAQRRIYAGMAEQAIGETSDDMTPRMH